MRNSIVIVRKELHTLPELIFLHFECTPDVWITFFKFAHFAHFCVYLLSKVWFCWQHILIWTSSWAFADIFFFKCRVNSGPAASLSAFGSIAVHPAIKRGEKKRRSVRLRTFAVTLSFRFLCIGSTLHDLSGHQTKRLNFQRRLQIISNLLQSQHLCQVHHLFHLYITLLSGESHPVSLV